MTLGQVLGELGFAPFKGTFQCRGVLKRRLDLLLPFFPGFRLVFFGEFLDVFS